MNLPFITRLIETGTISPAVGRLLEASFWSLVGYLLGVAMDGDPFSWQAFIQAILTPIAMFVRKHQSDNQQNDG